MKKSGTMKKMLTYYKPYMRVFWTDMFFATLSAAVALIIPLVVRYVTYNLVYREPAEILRNAGGERRASHHQSGLARGVRKGIRVGGAGRRQRRGAHHLRAALGHAPERLHRRGGV